MNKINIIVPWYWDANEARRGEIAAAMKMNVMNDLIARRFVLMEEDDEKRWNAQEREAFCVYEKIVTERRTTYDDAINLAALHCQRETVVIANADCFFDRTLVALVGVQLGKNALCLTRHESSPGHVLLEQGCWSQDAWIFEAPLNGVSADFEFGQPGCDNRFAYLLQQAGYNVSNPCQRIIVHHLHASKVRHYSAASNPRITQPFLPVTLTSKLPWPETEPVSALTEQIAVALIPSLLTGRDPRAVESNPVQWGRNLKATAEGVAKGLGNAQVGGA